MKGALLTAAVLLGSAQAGGVHKMKIKKIPLSEQLVSIDDNSWLRFVIDDLR